MQSSSVRDMQLEDLPAVERIYSARVSPHSGRCRQHRQILARIEDVLSAGRDASVALVGVSPHGDVLGYLAGDVRCWEFGSEPAGWIFALGVDPRAEGQGLGQRMLATSVERFRALGIRTVRTMVRKDDVAVLRFFRSRHFQAGPYVELELSLAQG